ncbi:MAG TPA: hypothetical protein VGG74_07490 [Kofleriaceae bacterium]|jgi:hypothetical protein
MSDRGRAFLIFGVIGAVAAAAIFYFFEIYRPKQVLRDAQAQVDGWEARWASARSCLLGPTPASPSTREALAIHELSEKWDRGTCTALMGKLTRGDVPNTGLPIVETAWRELDRAASKAAAAFAEHVDSWEALSKDNPLPGALDALDAARAKLRTSVELPAETTIIPPLRTTQSFALADGGDPVTSIDLAPASAHGLVTFGKTKSGRGVQIVLPVGGTPSVARVIDGGVRGVPDASWGAVGLFGGKLAIGAMDADGKIAAPIANDAKGVTSISAVLGTLADGTIIFGAAGTLGVAHVKAGVVTLEPPIAIGDGNVAVDADGRAALWWYPAGSSAATMSLRAFGFGSGAAVSSPTTTVNGGCLTAARAQIGSLSFDGTTAADTPGEPDIDVLGCTRDVALLDHRGDLAYAICGASCRDYPVQKLDVAVGVVGDQLVTVNLLDGVLAVWRNKVATFYSAPAGDLAKFREVVWSDGKVLDVLANTPSGMAIVRAPLH